MKNALISEIWDDIHLECGRTGHRSGYGQNTGPVGTRGRAVMRPLRRKCERARENISEKVCSMYGKKLDFLSWKVTVSDGIACEFRPSAQGDD